MLVFPAGGWASPPETIIVDAAEPLEVRACTPGDFDMVLVAPELAGGWYLLRRMNVSFRNLNFPLILGPFMKRMTPSGKLPRSKANDVYIARSAYRRVSRPVDHVEFIAP